MGSELVSQDEAPLLAHRKGALIVYKTEEKMLMARAFAEGGLFGVRNAAAAFSLIMIAEAEGVHPAKAMQEYDVIEGKPVRKAEKCAARFIESGGKIKTLIYTDDEVRMHFSHPLGEDIEISWTIQRARDYKNSKGQSLADKDNWKNNRRQMLRSRCWAEGTKTCYPGYADITLSYEEMIDESELRNVTPTPEPQREETRESAPPDDREGDEDEDGDEAEGDPRDRLDFPPIEKKPTPSRPATEIGGDQFLKGKARDAAVALLTEAMKTAFAEGGREAVMLQWQADAKTRRTRLSPNMQLGLEDVREQICAVDAPAPDAEGRVSQAAGDTEDDLPEGLRPRRGEELYNDLRDKLYACLTPAAIKTWTQLLTHPVLDALGDDWRDALNNEYKTHKQVTLGERAPG